MIVVLFTISILHFNFHTIISRLGLEYNVCQGKGGIKGIVAFDN